MTIGERIKRKRIELNLTQDELAQRVGYKSRSSINKIESARDLPLAKVNLMANALNTTPAYLLGWESLNNSNTNITDKTFVIANKIASNKELEQLFNILCTASQEEIKATYNMLIVLKKKDK